MDYLYKILSVSKRKKRKKEGDIYLKMCGKSHYMYVAHEW